jgi:hypothetical protein
MSVAEIEQKVIEMTEGERRQFAAWFYENEERIFAAGIESDLAGANDIAPEVMDELVRRRKELENGVVAMVSPDETIRQMREAVDEVRRSRH